MSDLINKLRERAAYIRSISAPRYKDQAAQIYDEAAAALEAENARIAGLEAARIAYASEFAPDAEGLPDVGSIHANIRALKKDAERYRWLRDSNNFVDGGIIVGNAEGEDILWDESLDRAIDAAIAKEPK